MGKKNEQKERFPDEQLMEICVPPVIHVHGKVLGDDWTGSTVQPSQDPVGLIQETRPGVFLILPSTL